MKSPEPRRRDDSHWLRRSFLLLASSWALLAVGFFLYHFLHTGHTRMTGAEPRIVAGHELTLSGAAGEPIDTSLRVVSGPKARQATAMARDVSLTASDYDYVEVDLTGYRPTMKLLLLWSTSAALDEIQGTPLAWIGRSRLGVRVGSMEPWQGIITAVGVGIVGPLEDPITIQNLRLVPSSPGSLLATLWQEWTAFEGWDGHSMNFVIGGSSEVSPLVRPVPTVAAWMGLALLLYGVIAASGRWGWDARVVGSVVVLGWLLLDARWQLDLWRQLGITHQLYAGKSWPDKRLAAEDGSLFRFAMAVKQHLPEEPQVLFLLTRDPEAADRYLALRARYHLLPHNVCSYYSHPPRKDEVRQGSYILVMHPRSDIVYDESSRKLYWDPEGGVPDVAAYPTGGLPADLVFSSEHGTLYWRR